MFAYIEEILRQDVNPWDGRANVVFFICYLIFVVLHMEMEGFVKRESQQVSSIVPGMWWVLNKW